MNRSRLRPHLAALLTAIVACVGLLSLITAPAWAKAGTITEFPFLTNIRPNRPRLLTYASLDNAAPSIQDKII